ncbi:hypothetical protein XELAEV_18022613mg [Xenopus laevis]|uniref:Uncharacterized protein n=1 Tax=Xenopus laevis TaxID=8355 RepID=A0A974D4H5_XENLA|nr:hypothetical protein XELAEV_18022613mg [Xenopus laevis]
MTEEQVRRTQSEPERPVHSAADDKTSRNNPKRHMGAVHNVGQPGYSQLVHHIAKYINIKINRSHLSRRVGLCVVVAR